MSFEINKWTEVTQIVTLENKSLGVMSWGSSNSFPQTLKNLIEQSPNSKPAVSREAAFLKGGSFEGESIEVGTNGLTLKDLVSSCAEDWALFRAVSIHVNYKINIDSDLMKVDGYTVSSMSPMEITTLRFNTFDSLNYANKIAYHPNFGLNSEVVKLQNMTLSKGDIGWFDRFNVDGKTINAQIKTCKDGDIENYKGQVLYYSEAGYSKYPVPVLQSQINFVLSDIDNSVLVRKETATGFIDTYLLKTMKGREDDSLLETIQTLENAQGAHGVGKIVVMAELTEEEMRSDTLERIESDKASIMDSSIKTFELTKKQLTGAYLIPPSLAGIDQSGGFSGADLQEAYDVYNAITQQGRDIIEAKINFVLKHGNFGISEIKLQPLKLILPNQSENETTDDVTTDDNEAENKTMTDLTGRQTQNIFRIVRKYHKEEDEMTESMARSMLKTGFGMSDEMVDSFLGIEKEVKEVTEKDKEDV